MDIQARINQILGQIAAAEKELARAQAALTGQQVRLQEWVNKVKQSKHGASAEDKAAILDAQTWIQTHQSEISAAQSKIASLKTDLANAQKAQQQYDAAYASATEQGLSGSEAAIRAEAEVKKAEGRRLLLKYIGIGLLILMIAAAIVYYRKKRKGK